MLHTREVRRHGSQWDLLRSASGLVMEVVNGC
jgi:hypothetical protein